MSSRLLASPEFGKRPPVRFVQLGRLAFRVNIRVLLLIGISALALVALAAWALTLGSFRLPLADVLGALTGSGTDDANFIVLDLRLPRVLVALMIGPMLAMSGAIFQGLVRNPLVSPDIIGINAGAALFAVFWIVTGRSLQWLPIVAFIGAVVAAMSIYILSWQGNISAARLILVGIGMNAVFSAGTSLLIIRADINDASRAVLWQAGSVYASTWSDVRVLLTTLIILVPSGIGLMWALRVVQLGDMTARSVGMPLERTRLALILVGCGFSAVAVSIAGPIGFVALMIPHLARMIAGPIGGGVLVFAGILGALLVLGSDMIGQHALPVTLPVGVITAALGAPYFLFLLYRMNTQL